MSFDDIIAKVRAHPELWQSSHPFYRHRVVCAKTWKEITAELEADDWIVIKKRWKHLKDTFRKEIKKVSSNQVMISTWIHYNELYFLADEVTKKHKKPEYVGSQSDSESEKKPLKTKRLKRKIQKEPTVIPSVVEATSTTQSSLKFKKILRSLSNVSKAMKRSTNFPDEHLKNDTDHMFLVSLLPTMKNLSDVQKLHFRGKINNWLLNAMMENQYSQACDSKMYVETQLNDGNIQD